MLIPIRLDAELLPGDAPAEAQVLRWLVAEGQRVERGQSLLELETDKATVEIASPADGVLTRIVRGAGEKAHAGEDLGFVDASAQPAEPEVRAQTQPAGLAWSPPARWEALVAEIRQLPPRDRRRLLRVVLLDELGSD